MSLFAKTRTRAQPARSQQRPERRRTRHVRGRDGQGRDRPLQARLSTPNQAHRTVSNELKEKSK